MKIPAEFVYILLVQRHCMVNTFLLWVLPLLIYTCIQLKNEVDKYSTWSKKRVINVWEHNFTPKCLCQTWLAKKWLVVLPELSREAGQLYPCFLFQLELCSFGPPHLLNICRDKNQTACLLQHCGGLHD